MSPPPDRLAQIFLIHRDVDNLVLFVQGNGTNQGRLQRVSHKLIGVITPANDVDLLIVELAHDVLHPRPAQAHTGTHRIHLLVVAVDCHLRPVAGFPGNAPNLHRVIGNLTHLRLEETTHKVRVTTGEDDLRPTQLIVHRHHVGTDAISDVVILSGDPFARRHAGLELAEIDHHVVLFEAPHGPTHDVASPILELVIDHLLLRLAETLHHGLLGRLHRDPPEVLRRHVELDGII